MKLGTVEEAIKWLVDHPREALYAPNGHAYRYSGGGFADNSRGGQIDSWTATSCLPLGPYHTKKPRPERTIEESLEKLSGLPLSIQIQPFGAVTVRVKMKPNCKVNHTLQAALSALVDEIEDEEEG